MRQLDRTTRIGFVGLGNLGLPMATALVRDGWSVTAYDLRADAVAAAVANGAHGAQSLADLAGCGILALAVSDDAAVTQTVHAPGLLASLADDAVVVVHSTVLPATATALDTYVTAAGAAFVDAPVSGGAARAAQGTLTVMAGAGTDALAAASDYLSTVAEHVVHVGAPGSGAVVKLANQLMMFAALAGTHEALALADAYGVDPATVLGVVQTSTGDSWVARTWGFFDEVTHAYDAAGAPVSFRPWSKDLWDVVAAAREADVALPVAGLLAQVTARMVEDHAHRESGR